MRTRRAGIFVVVFDSDAPLSQFVTVSGPFRSQVLQI